jgi:hypothetical protein
MYLDPLGTWQSAPVLFQQKARNSKAQFALPTPAEGAWRIETILVGSNSSLVAAGGSDVLINQTPAIYLRLSRPIAGTLDNIRATLLTAAGKTPQAGSLAVWLVRPDGKQLGLPTLLQNELILRDGMIANERLTLLNRLAGISGPGAYQVHARLFDSVTGRLITRASAGFQVCDDQSTIQGSVYAANGDPLGGATKIAAVNALDLDDRTVVATASLNTQGVYALTVPAGRYVISATVWDANGVHRATGSAAVGCGTSVMHLDLTAAAPTPALANTGKVRQ